MSESEVSLVENRSKLREFVTGIASIRGDLSNITAPPFVLDTKSAVELPAFWAERPSVFVAPALAEHPAERALLVAKWFLSSLRNQQYAGRPADAGIKKPLNAFLGEIFLAKWEDEAGTTRLVSEQVSHHPPVTACRVWNEEYGIAAEGYTRQEITFSGSMNINQIGHATLYLSKHKETYLIPLPNIKVKGILTGGPYPELQGTHYIPSTTGYTSVIDFSGRGFFGGSDKKHSFVARVHHDDDEQTSLYTISGNWDGKFTIHDCTKNVDIETFDVMTAKTTPLQTDSIDEQDSWESRRAWRGVREALQHGNMQGTVDAKNKLENGQREMHTADADGRNWSRLFFTPQDHTDEVAESLARRIGVYFKPEDTVAAWSFKLKEWQDGRFKKPYRGDLAPDNTRHERPAVPRDDHTGAVDGAATGVAMSATASATAPAFTGSEPMKETARESTSVPDAVPAQEPTSNSGPISFHDMTTIGNSQQRQEHTLPVVAPAQPQLSTHAEQPIPTGASTQQPATESAPPQSRNVLFPSFTDNSPQAQAMSRPTTVPSHAGARGGPDDTSRTSRSGVDGVERSVKDLSVKEIEDFLRDQVSSKPMKKKG